MNRIRTTFAVVALGAVVASCGGGRDDELTAAAESQLAPLAAQVRDRASSFDPDGARVALEQLRGAVSELLAADRLGDDRADDILAAAADVEHRLATAPTTTTTTTTTTTAPPAPIVVPDDDDDGDDDERGAAPEDFEESRGKEPKEPKAPKGPKERRED